MINRNPHPLPRALPQAPIESPASGLKIAAARRRQDMRALRAIVVIAFVVAVVIAYVVGGIVATRDYAQDVETAYASGSQGCGLGR